jgi:3-dehydroquinate synthase
MTEVPVELGARRYSVQVGRGAAALLPAVLSATGRARRVVVSSPRVWRHQGPRFQEAAASAAGLILVPDGETRKNRRTLDRLHDAFLDAGLARDGLVIAFGGGVVGDVAGYAAATYMRGVDWVVAPTTLLAMADAAIGGKVGIDHPRAKNLIGAFHQPRAGVADLDCLATLPARQARSGAYEVLKCGAIADPALFAAMAAAPPSLASWAGLEAAVAAACRIKAGIVAGDEREADRRRLLNFGHTVGHALETVTAYRRFTHGEAVGWGMAAAAWIASARGLLDEAGRAALLAGIDGLGRRPPIADLPADDILAALARDKKSSQGRVPFVLPTRIGAVVVEPRVEASEVRAALRALGGPGGG